MSLSNAAFADDLSILTSRLTDLKAQADKLSQYSDWAHMKVNEGKTLVSGILYQNIRTRQYGNGEATTHVRRQLENQIKVQGKMIKYLDPGEPFRYLGAWLTMTLDWKHQHAALTSKAKQKMERLMMSHATPRQVLHIIKTSVRPAITNTLGITPCTKTDIHILDSIINAAAKQTYGIGKNTATAFVNEDTDAFGLGCESLMTEYAHKSASLLIESLRDDGRIGIISKALLDLQLKLLGGHHASPYHYKRCLRVRQLAHLLDGDITIMKNDTPQFTQTPQLVAALRQLNPQHSTHPWQMPCDFLQPLFRLGIHSLAELTDAGGKHIIDGRALKLKMGRRVKAKHIVALNRLANLLSEAPGHDKDTTSILRAKNSKPSIPGHTPTEHAHHSPSRKPPPHRDTLPSLSPRPKADDRVPH